MINFQPGGNSLDFILLLLTDHFCKNCLTHMKFTRKSVRNWYLVQVSSAVKKNTEQKKVVRETELVFPLSPGYQYFPMEVEL